MTGAGGYAVTAGPLALSFSAALGGFCYSQAAMNCCAAGTPIHSLALDSCNNESALAMSLNIDIPFYVTRAGTMHVISASLTKSSAICGFPSPPLLSAEGGFWTSFVSAYFSNGPCGTQSYSGPAWVPVSPGSYAATGSAVFDLTGR